MKNTHPHQHPDNFSARLIQQAQRRDPALAQALSQAAQGQLPQDPNWISPDIWNSENINRAAALDLQNSFNQAAEGLQPQDRERAAHQTARLIALPARHHTETFWDTGDQDPRAPELQPRISLAMRHLPLTRAVSCNATSQRRFYTWHLARYLRLDTPEGTHLALDQLSDICYGIDIPTFLHDTEPRPARHHPANRQEQKPPSQEQTARQQRRNAAAGAAYINLLWTSSPWLATALDRAVGWGNSLNLPWLHQPQATAARLIFQAFSTLGDQLGPRERSHLAQDLSETLTHQAYNACDALESPQEAHPDTLQGLRYPQSPDPHPGSQQDILSMLNHHHITNLFQANDDISMALLEQDPQAFRQALLTAGEQVTMMQANSLSLHLPPGLREGIEDIVDPLLAERSHALSQAARPGNRGEPAA